MPDFFDEVGNLVDDITDFKITKAETAVRIENLKKKYGKDAFPDIHFQKEERPWRKEYLYKLKKMNITGACSEEFLLHMAEVSEEIASRKKKVVRGIAVAVAALIIFLTGILIKNHSQPAPTAVGLSETAVELQESADEQDVGSDVDVYSLYCT